MGWIIIVALAYAPIIYRTNKRLTVLEQQLTELNIEVKRLNGK